MKKSEVLEFFGKKRNDVSPIIATAEALGLTRQAIYLWGDDVPKSSQPLIELESGGKLKRDKQ